MKRTTKPPTVFAITLKEAKAQCVVEHGLDDELLNGFIKSAQDFIEGLVGFPLTETEQTYYFDCFSAALDINTPNINDGTAIIKYRDGDDVEQTLTLDEHFYLDPHVYPAQITPVESWPATYSKPNAVTVTVMAGPAETAGDPVEPPVVAAGLKQAMALLVGHWYNNREAEIVGTTTSKVQLGLESLLRRHGVIICG